MIVTCLGVYCLSTAVQVNLKPKMIILPTNLHSPR